MSQQDAYSLNNLLGWNFLKFKRFEQCDHVDFLNECSFWYHFSSLIKKDVFVLSQAWDKENSESPWGIKPQAFRFCALMLYHWATESSWWVRSITKFIIIWHVSCILLASAMLIAISNWFSLYFALFITGTKKIQWKYTSLRPLWPQLISNYQIIELTKVILFYWFIISFNAGINSSHQMTKPRKLEVMHFNKS